VTALTFFAPPGTAPVGAIFCARGGLWRTCKNTTKTDKIFLKKDGKPTLKNSSTGAIIDTNRAVGEVCPFDCGERAKKDRTDNERKMLENIQECVE
jgi:hypothetical protein